MPQGWLSQEIITREEGGLHGNPVAATKDTITLKQSVRPWSNHEQHPVKFRITPKTLTCIVFILTSPKFNYIPGGGVSWILFFLHHSTGKIFLELELHHMTGLSLLLQSIMLSISTWKKISFATWETVAAQIDEGSFGLTASSFIPVVNSWGLGKLSDWKKKRKKAS